MQKIIKNKEGFEEHRGYEVISRPRKRADRQLGIFSILYSTIIKIYKFLLVFSSILIGPFKYANIITDSFKNTFNNISQLFNDLYTMFENIGTYTKTFLKNFYGVRLGMDQYDFMYFFKHPIKSINSLTGNY